MRDRRPESSSKLSVRYEFLCCPRSRINLRRRGAHENHTIFEVLKVLEKARISFRLARDRPDTIRTDATLYGLRLEIECFDDNHIKVSTFRGTEDVDGEYDYLLKMIAEHSID